MNSIPEPLNPSDPLTALMTLIRAGEVADEHLRAPQRLRIHASRLRITANLLDAAARQTEAMDKLWGNSLDEISKLRARVAELEAAATPANPAPSISTPSTLA